MRRITVTSARRAFARSAAAATAALVTTGILTACGGDDGGGTTVVDDEATPGAGAGAGQLDEGQPEVPLEDQTVEVGAEIYFAGFRVEVEAGRVVVDEESEEVTAEVDAVVENLRPEDALFPTDELELQWAAESALATEDLETEAVRTGASAGLTFQFLVDETFTFRDAVLYAGPPAEIQAVVPLSEPDGIEPAAPISLVVPTAGGSDGPVEATITDLTLLAYDPWHVLVEQQPLDQPVLSITVDVTRTDTDTIYDANVLDDSFRLVLPDGTEIAPNSSPNELLEPGSTLPDQAVTFVLEDIPFTPDELPAEDYALVVSPTSVSWDDDPEARIPFALQPAS